MSLLKFRHLKLPILLTIAGLLPASGARAQAPQTVAKTAYNWKNVAVSGLGCWVTGIEIHPRGSHATYIRTDVGGAYRWDAANARWISLSNHFNYPQANYYGVESLALDANAPDVVYMACGAYADRNAGDGALFKSIDQGKTWRQLGLHVPMGGNQERRWGGERLVVSPHDGKVSLFGSRRNGLWRSMDGGETWTQNAAIPVAKDNLGVVAVAFDAATAGTAYAAVSSAGLYRSSDNGANWAIVPGAPDEVRRLMSAADGSLWITSSRGVSKYRNGKWHNFTPSGVTDPYCGIAINPANSNDVVVSDLDHSINPSETGRLYRTLDGGANWKRLPAQHQQTVPWSRNYPIVRVSALAFNPANLKQVWGVSGAGILRTDDIDAATLVFPSVEAGHEETCINVLATPPSGPELLSGMLDVDGFVHDNGLDNYPSRPLKVSKGDWIAYTLSIAYQEGNPAQMLRIGTQKQWGLNPSVVTSSDAGNSWYPTNFPKNLLPLHGVISATDAQNIMVMCNQNVSSSENAWKPVPVENPWQFTRDGGASWQASQGLPRESAPLQNGVYGTKKRLAADPKNGGTFYVLSQDDGLIYRSIDGGANFSARNAAQPLPTFKSSQFKTQPGVAGALWASFTQDSALYHATKRLPDEGLYRSSDGGANWTKLRGVSSVVNFGWGKAAPAKDNATLFLYGRLAGDNVDKIYRSTDVGQSWTDITDPDNPVGNQPLAMEGSRQTFGRVFIGTNGSGIFYGDVAR